MSLNENQLPDPAVVPKDVAKEDILQKLNELFKDASARKQFANLLKNERPRHWRKATNAPYYKERFALEIKTVLDNMMKDGEDRIYKYVDFPGLSRSSIYLRVNQSKLYLLQELDPDNKYKDFLDQISITREKTGVRLSFHRDIRSGQMMIPERIITLSTIDELRAKIDTFLESSKVGEEFFLDKLSLEIGEIQTLEASFMALENIVASVTPSYIKLVRIA